MSKSVLILSMSPFAPGGVPYMLNWVVRALEETGRYKPTVLCDSVWFPREAVWEEGELLIRKPETRLFSVAGMKVIFARTKHPLAGISHARQARVFGCLHDRFDIIQVVGGANVLGLGPVIYNREFAVWVATTLDSEHAAECYEKPNLSFKHRLALLLYKLQLPAFRRIEAKVFQKASGVFGISPFTLDVIRKMSPNVLGRERWIPVPVDAASVDMTSVRPEPGRIIFAGRTYDPRKNLSLLVSAFSRVQAKLPWAKLVIAGGTLPTHIIELIHGLGLDHCIEAPGHVPLLSAELKRADIMVIPSRQEGLNIAGLEAMAYAVPVVATRCGGPECYVLDGVTGLLINNGDEIQLAEALTRLISDRSLRDRLGSNARELVLRDYNPKSVITAFDTYYKTIG